MEGYINRIHEMTNEYHKRLLKMYDFYLRLYGTTVEVERLVRKKSDSGLPSRDQMTNQVYGKRSSQDIYDPNHPDVERFETKLIINKSRSESHYDNNMEVILCYTNKKELDLGDKIQFNRYGRVYNFKVTDFKTYEDYLFEYELTGIKEFKLWD